MAEGLRVLIVDDSREFRAAARELLEWRGYVVDEAGSAADALVAAEQHRPDAALVDVRLGKESGFALVKSLTAAYPTLAIVLVSTSDPVTPEVVRECGARAFVPKGRLHHADLERLLAPGSPI